MNQISFDFSPDECFDEGEIDCYDFYYDANTPGTLVNVCADSIHDLWDFPVGTPFRMTLSRKPLCVDSYKVSAFRGDCVWLLDEDDDEMSFGLNLGAYRALTQFGLPCWVTAGPRP